MKQEIKDRWVKALESGEYDQTKGYLHDEDGYCCLGVLCEIAKADGVLAFDADENTYVSATDKRDYSDVTLPRAVLAWADMSDSAPVSPIQYTYEDGTLRPGTRPFAHYSELNDDMDFDFKKIAEVIKNDPNL